MREIKFRAWDVERGGWIAGFNMVNYHGYYNKGFKPNIFRYSSRWEDGEFILEQFTGLLDKNGKEIYEGDILGARYSFPGVVEFSDAHFAWGGGPEWGEIFSEDVEIIGNVHENSELMEK